MGKSIGYGILAGYLAIVVHGSFWLRRKIGVAIWRRLHRLTFALFVLAAAHGLLAGTDAAAPFMIVTYAATAGAVAMLLAVRILAFSYGGSARRTAEESA